VSDFLRGSASSTSGLTWKRVRSTLVIAEIAIAVVLLAAAATLIKTVGAVLATDMGVSGERTLTIDVTLPLASYGSPERVRAFYRQFDDEMRSVPGVELAGITNQLPGTAAGELMVVRPISVEGLPSPTDRANRFALALCASPDYFAALGIDLIAGRTFTQLEGEKSPPVMIVSERYGRSLQKVPSEIVGRRAALDLGGGGANKSAEIVGVVRNVKMRGPESEFDAAAYLPCASEPIVVGATRLVVKTTGDPVAIVSEFRAAIARIDPNLPLYQIRTFADIRAAYLAERRFAMLMFLLFGVATFALAVIGLYGVISYLVAARTRETGIRLALGAPNGTVLMQVMVSGLIHTSVGIMVGIALAVASWKLVVTNVPGVGTLDLTTLSSVGVAIMLVAIGATWVPARRATDVEPWKALRVE
jgi:putative ABC transport system permease protein